MLKQTAAIDLYPTPEFSRDLAFVIKRPLVQSYGFACPLKTKDADAVFNRGGRHLFVAPWRGKTLVGVWHGTFYKSPDEVSTSEKELQGYLDEVNDAYPDFNLTLEDIAMVLTGLTLYGESSAQSEGEMSFGKRSILIDHAEQNNVDGLVSLIGVRATTARGMAEKAIDLIFRKLRMQGSSSVSSSRPIYGGDFKSFDSLEKEMIAACPESFDADLRYSLMRNYGTRFYQILDYGKNRPELMKKIGKTDVIGAEIVHAVREEMALRLCDVVFRRTGLGTLGELYHEQICRCAKIMAEELGWDQGKQDEEIALVEQHLSRRGYIYPE
jgi:glycerol-3-phosphate dehydrogenase